MYLQCSLILLSVVVAVSSHQAPSLPGMNQQQVHHQVQAENIQRRAGAPPHNPHSFKEGARDRGHVMEHLDGVVNRDQDIDRMSEDEVQFHYFKLHDYDNNNMLDGLELCAALTHYHADEDPNNVKPLTDADLKKLVDTILVEDDRNNDGYVDYAEFIVSQRA